LAVASFCRQDYPNPRLVPNAVFFGPLLLLVIPVAAYPDTSLAVEGPLDFKDKPSEAGFHLPPECGRRKVPRYLKLFFMNMVQVTSVLAPD